MVSHNLKIKSNIIAQYSYEDRTITVFNDSEYPNDIFDNSNINYYGISIVDSKYSNKLKYTTWDCILLTKEDLIKVCSHMKDIRNYDGSLYVKCTCFSELLEVSTLDNSVYISLWDNYFSRYNKKIFKSEIEFTFESAKSFANDVLKRIG